MGLRSTSRYLFRTSWKVNLTFFTRFASSPLYSKIKQLVDSRRYRQALITFKSKQSAFYDDTTCHLALKACANLKDFKSGANIHRQLTLQSLENPFIQVSLINFYMKCGDVVQAEAVFSSIEKKTNYVYAAMYKGYLTNNMPGNVLKLFERLPINFDEVIAVLLFNACAKLSNNRAIKVGCDTLRRIPRCFLQNQILVNSIIDMLMKFGDVNKAEEFFHKSPKKTLVTYGALIQGYVTNNLFEKALDTFQSMTLKPDAVLYSIAFSACAALTNDQSIRLGQKIFNEMPKTFYDNCVVANSAIKMYFAFGEVRIAEKIFSQMKMKDSYTYSIMMNGYVVNQAPEKCLSIFEEFKQLKMRAHESMWVSLFGACSQIGILSIAQRIIQRIPLSDISLITKTTLIDMWGKCGSITKAEEVFQSISRPDIVTYTSMVNAYARNGMGYEAIDLYNQIPESTRNDDVSHICVLNACSHSGLIEQARIIFNNISKTNGEIVTVMVDCLSRMALFDQAQKLIDDYEKDNAPYMIMYMAMLSAARNYCKVDLCEKIYDRIKSIFPGDKSHLVAGSILLANIYSTLGDSQKVQAIRNSRLKEYGTNVNIGVSWTEVDGELVKFKAHDRSHPRSDEIYAELMRLSAELKQNGHEFDSSWITRPLKNEETIESVLCGHSEKLAIAFNFIHDRRPSVIQITKNLRVCGDCHRATKLIAKIRQCKIIVRDANRIHHFQTNGQCSCQGHF